MAEPVRLGNIRRIRELETTLRKIRPHVETLANTGGCGVSIFFLRYIERALDGKVEDGILRWTYPNWDYKDPKSAIVVIKSRANDWDGVFMSCERVIRTDILDPDNPERNRSTWDRFGDYAKSRLDLVTMENSGGVFSLIMGASTMEMLGNMRDYCVEYRQDKGSHLLFHEQPGTNNYLKIYLGHWMDESQTFVENE